MKKIVIDQVLKNFLGEDIVEDGSPLTFKTAILVYLNNVHRMNLTSMEDAQAFEVAMLIGSAKKDVQMNQQQYDFLKKLCDKGGKVKVPQVGEQPLFAIVVSQQLKKIVDDAETIDDKVPSGVDHIEH